MNTGMNVIGTVLYWIIMLAVHKSLGAVTPIVLSTTEIEKNGNLSMSTTSTDTTIDWTLNGVLPSLSTCIIGTTTCTVMSVGNIVFASDSSRLTTLTITLLSHSANEGSYKAESNTGASSTVSIIVSSPPIYVSWTNQPISSCSEKSVTLTAVITCVYPSTNIEVIFEIFNQTGSIANSSVNVQPIGSIGCESHETNLKAEATLSSTNYSDQSINVSASVRHSLLPSKPPVRSALTTVCFTASKNEKSVQDHTKEIAGGTAGGIGGLSGVVIIVVLIVRRKGPYPKLANVGDSVVFPCSDTSSTDLLELRKDNIAVGRIDNIICESYNPNKKSFTVHFVEIDHGGQYACMVGEKRLETFQLTVCNPEYKVDRGNTITLLPGLKTSYKVNRIEWQKGSKVILTENDSTKYRGGIIDELPLTIKNAQRRDAGDYKCTIYFNDNIKEKIFKLNLNVLKGQDRETKIDLPSDAKRHQELDPLPGKIQSEHL